MTVIKKDQFSIAQLTGMTARNGRHPRILSGLWKAFQEEWSKIYMIVLRKSLLSWKIRARAIVKNHGYQIEVNRLKNYRIYT